MVACLQGHVYVGVPPLYRVDLGRGSQRYLYSEAELKEATAGMAPGSYSVQRFKVGGWVGGQAGRGTSGVGSIGGGGASGWGSVVALSPSPSPRCPPHPRQGL